GAKASPAKTTNPAGASSRESARDTDHAWRAARRQRGRCKGGRAEELSPMPRGSSRQRRGGAQHATRPTPTLRRRRAQPAEGRCPESKSLRGRRDTLEALTQDAFEKRAPSRRQRFKRIAYFMLTGRPSWQRLFPVTNAL